MNRTTWLWFGICTMLNSHASTMKQATLTLQKVANTQMVLYLNNATWHGTIRIDLYDYRNKSEPMLWFEDLHDGITKTKFRFYMAPTNARFNSFTTWQDNTMLTEFNQNPWFYQPSPDIYMNRLRPAQKIKPHAWPPIHLCPQKQRTRNDCIT